MIITVFDNFWSTEPKHVDVSSVYKSIVNSSNALHTTLDKLSKAATKEEKDAIKKTLPCILFSGKFSKRADNSLDERSGLAVFDYDKLDETQINFYKDKLKLVPYVAMCFVSPSGNGLKVVVNIGTRYPHRDVYAHCLTALSETIDVPKESIDTTSINESRICFAAHDQTAYYNPQAEVYSYTPPRVIIQTNYNKVSVAANMVRLSYDGHKHEQLLKAAKLMGGYIQGGSVEEEIAVNVLRQEVENKPNVTNLKQAYKTIEDGIKYGKQQPLYETETIEHEAKVSEMKVRLHSKERKYEFLSDINEDYNDLMKYRTGGFQMGKSTGYDELDKHFLFKEGEFNVVIGHANTGKSYFMWWLMNVAAKLHGWRWIIYSTENKTRQIKKKLIEYYYEKPISDLTDVEFKQGVEWIDDKYAFIRTDRNYSALDILEYSKVLMSEREYKGFCIDPYNSLSIDQELWAAVRGNRHEYDYTVASQFVMFSDKHNISIYLNAHAATEALRKKHPNGHPFAGQPMPPEASDIEGGGKFVNRVTGFFMVVHRYIYHENEWKFTRLEVKKVKDQETGGIPTKYEEPIEFIMRNAMCKFEQRGTINVSDTSLYTRSAKDFLNEPTKYFDDKSSEPIPFASQNLEDIF
jgi:hypothetical protein